MKKLTIIFKDNSSIVYTMRNSVSHLPYLGRHTGWGNNVKSAVIQQYSLKNNQPVILIGGGQ